MIEPTKRTIPELRDAICEIASAVPMAGYRWEREQLAKQLRVVAAELKRRSPSRPKSPAKRAPLTPAEKRAAVAMALANPDMPLSVIAGRFECNPGRVSEALRELSTTSINKPS
jgi:hypothetical protein